MASKDRIQRLKEEVRVKILDAALQIAKDEGWHAVSMRKIADMIEYTAPIIYEYFSNKEAILLEIARKGYLLLAKDLKEAKALHETPGKQLEAMWFAYWDFAFANKELYQGMFGLQTNCCDLVNTLPEADIPYDLFSELIGEMMNIPDLESEEVCTKYYTFWSVVHGLISINILSRGSSEEVNRIVLQTTITGIINTING